MNERGLLPPEALAFCEARYQGGDYARPGTWREPIRYRDYVSPAVEPPNKKRSVTAFEYLWLEQRHSDLLQYHQPSQPVPRDDAKCLSHQRARIDRILGEWDRASETGPRGLLASVPAKAFLGAGGLFGLVLARHDPRPIRDGAFLIGILAGGIIYLALSGLHAGFLAIARHRRLVATVRREVEQEQQQVLERFLDEMHRTVNPRLQPYRR